MLNYTLLILDRPATKKKVKVLLLSVFNHLYCQKTLLPKPSRIFCVILVSLALCSVHKLMIPFGFASAFHVTADCYHASSQSFDNPKPCFFHQSLYCSLLVHMRLKPDLSWRPFHGCKPEEIPYAFYRPCFCLCNSKLLSPVYFFHNSVAMSTHVQAAVSCKP